MLNTLGERVRWLRKEAGVRQRELCELAGLTSGHIGAIESGRRGNPEAKTILGIASVLGVSVDWLLRGVGDPPSQQEMSFAVGSAKKRFAMSKKAAS